MDTFIWPVRFGSSGQIEQRVQTNEFGDINAGKFTKGVRVIGEDRYPVVIILLAYLTSKQPWITPSRRITALSASVML